ncbi:MAG TPA: hypothetical protein VMT10_14280 [Solirubrobacteraceae bacterium]|nr:hypothetical protein [Solirubrobacteraceae bacterium]
MPRTLVAGEMTERCEPEWDPLLRAVGLALAGDFMWMFEVRLKDGMSLQAYKHIDTRRYLHLGPEAEAFAFQGNGRYRRVELRCLVDAVYRTLEGWATDESLET